VDKVKSWSIPKRWVWETYLWVKANRGAAGVDEQSIEGFEQDLKDNLYKLWNRMCSGSYMPPPVKRVQIDKRDGGKRPLGIPISIEFLFELAKLVDDLRHLALAEIDR
jgi:RNA-directed DNA polymerase